MKTKTNNMLALLTLLMSALIIWSAITGIATPDFYARETDNWRLQVIGQDYINLFLMVPFLLNAALMIYKRSQDAALLWAGGVTYIIYTYTIYCFDVHFNALFVVYCLILGLAIFSLLYFIYEHRNKLRFGVPGKKEALVTGIYFMALALFFGFAWLSEILWAIVTHEPPASLVKGGLATNPVQVIDLAVCLPGLFIAGLLLLRRKRIGFVLTPVLLTFVLLMDLTIAILTLLTENTDPLPVIVPVMFGLAAFSLVLLALNFRNKIRIL